LQKQVYLVLPQNNMSIKDKLQKLKAQTVERPHRLEADVASRYNFAKKYCRDKKVLDVGCGFGLGTNIVGEVSRYVLGIDYSNEAIKNARKNKLKNVEFKTLDATKLAKIRERFDVILSFEIIEHLTPAQAQVFVRDMYSLLNKNGTLLLTTPNGLLTEFFFGSPHNPYHIKEYKPEELKDMLSKHFSKTKILGFSCTNKIFIARENEIKKSLGYRLAFILGHFKLIQSILAYVPRGFKRNVTKENILPELSIKDFVIGKKINSSRGLYIVSNKS